jgi:integrase
MHTASKQRRPRGTGSLISRRDRAGRTTYYGKFWIGNRQVMRRLGPKREPGSRYGLTKAQAESELRRAIDEARATPPVAERLTVAEAGTRYLAHLDALGRRRSTLADYESTLRVHLAPFFSGRTLDSIDPLLVERFVAAKLAEGKAPKSVVNWLGFLGSIFRFAVRRGWARLNPVASVEKPRRRDGEVDIRFLDREELEALIRAVPDDELGSIERVLYRAGAMTGLRRGELLALRWMDIAWGNRVIRVRRSFTRGEFGAPKSRRSSRAVPLADALAAELERFFQRSNHTADEDLVFAHPLTGGPYDPAKLRRRFQVAVQRAGLRPIRFHDLRHTFGTRMASAGAPLRAVQEWMGHRDFRTTLIYADYAPDLSQGARWAARAFGEPPRGRGGKARIQAPLT